MEDKSFKEAFTLSQGAPISYNGRKVHLSYRRHLDRAIYVGIRFIAVGQDVRQALIFSLSEGEISRGLASAKEMTIWQDKAPTYIELRCEPSNKDSMLIVWNAWENNCGEISYGMGCCGMHVNDQGNKVLLECSRGLNEPTFGDLVAELSFI